MLHYFTGGNPRLALMLYRIVANSEFLEVRRGLEKLLDEVTPYYKAKIEILPPTTAEDSGPDCESQCGDS